MFEVEKLVLSLNTSCNLLTLNDGYFLIFILKYYMVINEVILIFFYFLKRLERNFRGEDQSIV